MIRTMLIETAAVEKLASVDGLTVVSVEPFGGKRSKVHFTYGHGKRESGRAALTLLGGNAFGTAETQSRSGLRGV